jgi:hypothetical protein
MYKKKGKREKKRQEINLLIYPVTRKKKEKNKQNAKHIRKKKVRKQKMNAY